MKKYMKKLSALALALVLMMTAAAPVMAATAPSDKDTATAQVTGITVDGVTVTAYQVVKATYKKTPAEFSGYVAVDDVTIADPMHPTAEEIAEIAKNPAGLTSKAMTKEDGIYKANLEAGYWMVLVTGSNTVVYNPILVGVYYTKGVDDNTIAAGPISAADSWELEAENAYVKSTEPTIKKEIVTGETTAAKGADVNVGDDVDFRITAKIPSYSAEYTTPVVKIEDTLSDGLQLKAEPIVKVADAVVTAENYIYTANGTTGFSIAFKDAFIKANGGKDVVVTYSATVKDNAAVNFDPNTNTATLKYSNAPDDTTGAGEATDKSYSYTFSIGGKLTGNLTYDHDTITNNLIKIVKVNGEAYEELIKGDPDATTEQITAAAKLTGAEFTLYADANRTTVIDTVQSDASGNFAFKGVKAGTYYFAETKAPENFTLDTTLHEVKIEATYVESGENAGKLDTLKITIDGENTATYKATYTADGGTITTEGGTTTQVIYIKNTDKGALPSTGGMGTYLFTIIGVAIMAVAAGMFLTRRRRQA